MKHDALSFIHSGGSSRKRTLVVQVLVEGGQPVLQLISGVGAELDALGSLRRRVGDGQSAGFLARRLLFNHADAGVL